MRAARGRLLLWLGAMLLVSACEAVSGLDRLHYDRDPDSTWPFGVTGGEAGATPELGGRTSGGNTPLGGFWDGGSAGQAGDADAAGAGSGGQGGVSAEPEPDDAPTVLSVTPANGATHVTRGTDIVVRFSEPMDRASTEGAYSQSRGTADFSWNADSTVLTIADQIPYVETSDPRSINVPVTFGFAGTARDLAGKRLGTAFTSAFSMYRRVTQLLPLEGDLTGRVYVDAGRVPEPAAGDTDDDKARRALFTYVLDPLPDVPPAGIDSAIIFEEAVIETSIDYLQGNPFVDLGDAYINHVQFYSVLDGSAYDIAPLQELGVFIPASPQPVAGQSLSKSVLVALKDDFANRSARHGRSQYRVQFPIDMIADHFAASVVFRYGAVEANHLRVVYLFE